MTHCLSAVGFQEGHLACENLLQLPYVPLATWFIDQLNKD